MGEGQTGSWGGVQVFREGDMMAWIWMEAMGWGDSEPQGGLSRRAEARTASFHLRQRQGVGLGARSLFGMCSA